MSDKVVVRFLKAWRGYSAEELAGFDEEVAEGLKSKGFAEAYEKPKAGKGASAKASGAKNAGETGTAGSPPESSGAALNGAEGGEGNSGTDDDAKP
ncbi:MULTISPECIES: hypothetical protein [Pseudomonas]|uniref:hypothetical protein n=1 Tax=Pseudomonas TaxID=286 RepID=UPI000C86B4D8|nr:MULTISPECIES: hypothetical protein [Pseudomonas]MSU92934.1 hypothetical protein [Pseudomonas mandelii]PMV80043.1 hypothetical protein C1X56_31520 [Pseudomonas sp. GW101-1A09]PMV89367.1 hypothetical protein C1X51_25440 [Pseudomonas sp. FW306-2-2C-B10A]PMW01284.1 hypothetical protein C1X55_07235 [Pseudomonas sp. GW460-C8]PMW06605.1 hypothetical protein C1X50_08535 [Pseudomonas sp. MPR-TSA4]